jgi:MFS family permease
MYSGTIGYDGSMMNGLQTLEQWQDFMNHPTGAFLGLINALPYIGGLFMFPIEAFVADYYGRRVCLYIGVVFMCIGSAIQTAAHNHGMFIAGRFFVGVSTTWCGAAAILITEIAHPFHRGKVTALYQCQFCKCNSLSQRGEAAIPLTTSRCWELNFCLGNVWCQKHG